MNRTNIAWVDVFGTAAFSWNPITGCSPVSPGCGHCYARQLHNQRHEAYKAGKIKAPCYSSPFEVVRFHEDRLRQPLARNRMAGVFVCSMGDLFHEAVQDQWLDMIFEVMAARLELVFFLLTKRPERMRVYLTNLYMRGGFHKGAGRQVVLASGDRVAGDYFEESPLPLPNVWIGVTAENQEMADERVPVLLDTPAARRFVSVEPMLGPVDLNAIPAFDIAGCDELNTVTHYDAPWDEYLDWVICGGESGPSARSMNPAWARRLRGQCKDAGVPFFFKQMGGRGRDKGGKLLDGQLLQAWPEVVK